MYLTLKDRFETKNQRSKEVSQLKHLEQVLNQQASRDQSGNLASLANYRKSLHFTDPADIKIKNSYVEDLVEKNQLLKAKLAKIISGKVKMEYQEVKPIYLQALKSPFAMTQLSKLTP